MADLLYFLEPGYDLDLLIPQHKRIKNWANSNRKFSHTLHQTKTGVSFLPGGFA